MRKCSVTSKLEIVAGDVSDYEKLSHYHYRDSQLGPFAAIFVLKSKRSSAGRLGTNTVGVIAYKMPSPNLELRNIATGNIFSGFDRTTGLTLVNKTIRCISRVIIEPRFRGLGLASTLVRETMPRMNVPIIEAMAVMGLVNAFFEKAGMKAYKAKPSARCVQLIEALSMVGIEEAELVWPRKVQRKIEQLLPSEAEFIEQQIKTFLQSYGKRRQMEPGIERTRYVLSKLTFRPVYYIWFNPEMQLLTG
jgi:hypothetical protein